MGGVGVASLGRSLDQWGNKGGGQEAVEKDGHVGETVDLGRFGGGNSGGLGVDVVTTSALHSR